IALIDPSSQICLAVSSAQRIIFLLRFRDEDPEKYYAQPSFCINFCINCNGETSTLAMEEEAKDQILCLHHQQDICQTRAMHVLSHGVH
uniref:Uncharacterized protein n=1 Tax=Triticum urartu TaxID=4572 RepID=A0A8R7U5Y6_TRIUA